MLASVRPWSLIASFLLVSSPALATDGILLPSAPQGSGGEDSIETAEGTRCRQSLNSNGAYVDLGLSGRARTGGNDDMPGTNFGRYGYDSPERALAYARITIPVGKRYRRIDCSRLYELEIARLQKQVELLSHAAE